ncbi:NACHT domain-containing protein [Kitasatospora sp. NPDC050463]|uniref:NACHT domain-containing protein n=1 Tax=Kitasatospora sp. NPDC050463 TaxID=3155786 RepID=UPI003406B7FB
MSKAAYLPLGDLAWADVERLFLRLAERDGRAECAELYGTAGQSQEGIDLFVRNTGRAGGGPGASSARRYTTLQSKAVKSLGPAKIAAAVDKFLEGSWADRSEVFIYATTHELRPTQLADELNAQADRLEALGIRLERWGRERISELMRDLPELVDDFFGREWVKEFCGPHAAASLEGRLEGQDVAVLRRELLVLYRAAFAVQDTGTSLLVPSVPGGHMAPVGFVMLDIAEGGGDAAFGRMDGAGVQSQDKSTSAGPDGPGSRAAESQRDGALTSSSEGSEDADRELLVLDHLLQRGRLEEDLGTGDISRLPVDEWLADGVLSVVAGPPGAGKSSLLRHIVADLLGDEPGSTALADRFGDRLPVWLPFSFLCEHVRESSEHSVSSAVRAWLSRHSAQSLHGLVDKALKDDRLLLVVDGLDEWTDEESAHPALNLLEAFVRGRKVAAIVSSRPYALRRLVTLAGWRVGHIAPLSKAQQRALADMAFAASGHTPPASDTAATEAALSSSTSASLASAVDRFCHEVAGVAELEVLARVPLFLLMLVGMWSGGPLPARRVLAYERLVDVLVERHPAIRRRASPRPGPGIGTEEMRRILAAVAYRMRSRDAGFAADAQVWRTALTEVLCDEDLFGCDLREARRLAPQILEAAEGDLGVLVSHGAGSMGFAHRAVAEQLAAEWLLTRPLPEQQEVLLGRARDRSWREVLLAVLAGQQRPTDAAALLDTAITAGSENSMPLLGGFELVAEALGSGVRLTPRDVGRMCARICERVEQHPWMPHRARLLSSLVGALTDATARRSLLPWFSRKIIARTQQPGGWYELYRPAIPAEHAAPALLAGLRHPSPHVRRASVLAVTKRFAGDPGMRDALAALVVGAGNAQTQGAALAALVNGWPEDDRTEELVAWGRRQRATDIRAVAIRAARARQAAAGDSVVEWEDGERRWLLSALARRFSTQRVEDDALVEMVCEAAAGDSKVRDRCFDILSGSPGSPSQVWGDNDLAWWVLLKAFGTDREVIDWAAARIASEDHSLDNLAIAPAHWSDEPAIRDAVSRRLQREKSSLWGTRDLARLSPTPQTRDRLIALCLSEDKWQSQNAASALMDCFAQDTAAIDALRRKITAPDDEAAAFARVAGHALGAEAGMDRLIELLYVCGDKHVTDIISAIGQLWRRCLESVDGSINSGFDPAQAARVLQNHSHRDLALMCLEAIPDRNYETARGWTIGMWPEIPEIVEYARQALAGPEPEVVGVLYGYGRQSGPTADQIVSDAVALLSPLEPELRIVAAQQLARHGVETDVVVELLEDWRSDTSQSVRRAAASTLARALAPIGQAVDEAGQPRHRSEALERLRQECRTDLRAYGPDLDAVRRTAWTVMLLLGDVTLLDGLTERHNAEPVSVDLAHAGGAPNAQLAELIAAHWSPLQQQSEGLLVERLSRGFGDSEYRRAQTWSALAPAATRSADLSRALHDAVLAHPELLLDRQVLAWYGQGDSSDPRLMDLAIQAADAQYGGEPDPVFDLVGSSPLTPAARQSLLNRLIDHRDHPEASALITDKNIDFHVTSWRITVLARLLPDDPHAQSLYRRLVAASITDDALHWTWEQICAVVFGLAPAAHLPVLVLRISAQLQRYGDEHAAKYLVEAIIHRLRRDPEAEAAAIAAVLEPESIEMRTPLWASADQFRDTDPRQQQILLAAILTAAVGLSQEVADALIPLAHADDVLGDNPLMTPRPLALAILDLLDTAR